MSWLRRVARISVRSSTPPKRSKQCSIDEHRQHHANEDGGDHIVGTNPVKKQKEVDRLSKQPFGKCSEVFPETQKAQPRQQEDECLASSCPQDHVEHDQPTARDQDEISDDVYFDIGPASDLAEKHQSVAHQNKDSFSCPSSSHWFNVRPLSRLDQIRVEGVRLLACWVHQYLQLKQYVFLKFFRPLFQSHQSESFNERA